MSDKDLPKNQVDKPAKTDTFDLVFRGEIVPGNSLEEVKQRVAASFNLDSAAADQLFSGSSIRLKRGVDKATAERILQRLTDAGAIAIIVPNAAQLVTEESIPQSSLSLAPLGSNVMEASEKLVDKELVDKKLGDEEYGDPKPAVSKKRVLLSLDHLSLEPIGTNMVKETEVPAIKTPDLDTSKFSLE